MKILLPETYSKEFIFSYLPSIIYKRSISLVYQYKEKIEKLLKDNFNYTLEKFKEEYKNFFTVKKFRKYYILSIKQNNIINNIIRAIDYGIISFKPLHIFDKSFKYVDDNLMYIYDMWLHYIEL